MQRIRKGDKVLIIRGKDKPQTADDRKKASGEVLALYPERGTCIVAGKNLVWRHKRATEKEQQGGRAQVEAEIPLSNLMYFDEESSKAERIGIKTVDGRRVRYLKGSKKLIG